MRIIFKFSGLLLLAVAAACNPNGAPSNLPAASQFVTVQSAERVKLWGRNVVAVCQDARAGEAQCFALFRTGPETAPTGGSGPDGGFTPSQLEAAYNLPSVTKGSGQLVAIVDAYDDPNLASDLAFYRSYFGLAA